MIPGFQRRCAIHILHSTVNRQVAETIPTYD